jgi:hypothetical protein
LAELSIEFLAEPSTRARYCVYRTVLAVGHWPDQCRKVYGFYFFSVYLPLCPYASRTVARGDKTRTQERYTRTVDIDFQISLFNVDIHRFLSGLIWVLVLPSPFLPGWLGPIRDRGSGIGDRGSGFGVRGSGSVFFWSVIGSVP